MLGLRSDKWFLVFCFKSSLTAICFRMEAQHIPKNTLVSTGLMSLCLKLLEK